MKTKCVLSALLVFLGLMLVAQEKELPLPDDFVITSGTSFEAYENVVVSGTYNPKTVKTIKLNYWLNNQEHPIDVALNNGKWNAFIGSFFSKQSVLLNFEVMVLADTAKIAELRDVFVQETEQILYEIIQGPDYAKAADTQSLKKVFQTKMDSILPRDFDRYKMDNNVSLRVKLLESIVLDNNLKTLLNAIQEVKNDANDQGKIKEKDKLINRMIPSDQLLTELMFQTSLSDNQELKFVLKNFIGFDIVPVYFSGNHPNSTFGLFFTASPYFGRIDPDEKIWHNKSDRVRFDKNETFIRRYVQRFVSPTIGISLASSPSTNQVTPLVFAGLGFRINNIVRVTLGRTFYTQKYDTPVDGASPVIKSKNCWAFGVGLSTDYIGDFMKIFSTSVNQFGK